MKLYVAGPWADRPLVNIEAQKFRDAGHTVDCRWLTLHTEVGQGNADALNEDEHQEFLREQAMNDIEDLLNSDALVVINTQKSEGKSVETGIAIAALLPIMIVGKRTNIFHTLNMPIFATSEEAIAWIDAQAKEVEAMILAMTPATTLVQ